MMQKPIHKTAKLGLWGMLSLALSGLVLLPMAGRLKAAEVKTKTDTSPITLDKFLADAKMVLQTIVKGNQTADAALASSGYAEDSIILAARTSPAIGKPAITAYYNEGIAKGERVLTFDTVYQDIWMSGRYVFSIDRSALTIRIPQLEHLLVFYCKTLTVWEIQPDGTLKIKVDAWNFEQTPTGADGLLIGKGITAGNGAFHSAADSRKAADASSETLEKVKRLGKEFHAVCLKGDAALTASYYADNALYLADKMELIRGKDPIKAAITSFNRQFQLESLGDRILFAEGTEDMVYVVNQFEWKFKDVSQIDKVLMYPGKGVHVWQKQPDGSWKILVDINSPNTEY